MVQLLTLFANPVAEAAAQVHYVADGSREMIRDSQARARTLNVLVFGILFASIIYYPLYYAYASFAYLYHALAAGVFIYCVLLFRPAVNIAFVGLVAYGVLMSFVAVVGILISDNILHISQVTLYLILPTSLYIAGCNISSSFLLRCLSFLLLVVFVFTVLERAEFWLGIDLFGFVDYGARMKVAAMSYGADPTYARASGLFVNPNQLGFFAGAVLFAILSIRAPSRIRGLIPIGVMAVVLVILSGSRGSLIALGAAAVTYVSVTRSFRFLLVIVASALVVFAGYITISATETGTFGAFTDRLLYTSVYQNESLLGRMAFWSSVMDRVNLLTGTLIPPEMYLGHPVDSFYMRMLAQGGVLGLVSSVLLLGAQFASSRRLAPDRAKGAFWALITFVVVNSFSMMGLLDLEAVFVWTIMGLVASRQWSGGAIAQPGYAVAR